METSKQGIDLIKYFESLHDGDLSLIGLQPKMCPAGIWTEGYGHAMVYNGKFLKGSENKELAYKLHTVDTEIEASNLLKKDIKKYELDVLSILKVPVSQNQFDALISFAYNVGTDIDEDNIAEGLGDSTLLRYLNENKVELAAEEFKKWNKCNGKVLDGLTKRRKAEATLFLTGKLQL